MKKCLKQVLNQRFKYSLKLIEIQYVKSWEENSQDVGFTTK